MCCAMPAAASPSSSPVPGKVTVSARSCPSAAATLATAEESTPPDRNTPTGRSATRCRDTESFSAARTSRSASPARASSVSISGFHQRCDVPCALLVLQIGAGIELPHVGENGTGAGNRAPGEI